MGQIRGRPDPRIQILKAKIADLQQSLERIEKCVQFDAGRNLLLKAGMKIKIEAGGKVDLTSVGAMRFRASIIQLNPPTGQTAPGLAAAATAVAQALQDAAAKAEGLATARLAAAATAAAQAIQDADAKAAKA